MQIHGGDNCKIDLSDIIDEVIAVLDILERSFIDEANELWNLAIDVLLRVANSVPKNEVFGKYFEQNVVRIARFNCGEGVWNGYFFAHFSVV